MCGLVGAFGSSLYNADEDFFKDGLIASQLRGQDSTGIALVHGKKFNSTILKAAQDASLFVSREDVRKVFNKHHDIKVMMGHTRYATHGTVCDPNAHPFEHEHIVLAHNGGIWNKKDLPDGDKFQVDSEAICHSVAKIGAIETLRKINGAFALSFFDFDEGRFNLIRNEGRPLFYAKHKHRSSWYYASEGEMLLWILRRNKIDFDDIELLEESHLLTFDLKSAKFEIREVNYEKRPTVPDKTHWYPGSREPESEDKTGTVRGTSGTDGEAKEESKVTDISTRRSPFTQEQTMGPHGLGAEYLEKWGLKLGDTVFISMPTVDIVSPKSIHCKGLAYFSKGPNCDVWVYGFTEEDYLRVKNEHNRYFSRIVACFWDKKSASYQIILNSISSIPPNKEGKVVLPYDKYKIFSNTKKEAFKKEEFLPALPPPPPEAAIIKNQEPIDCPFEVVQESVMTQEMLQDLADQAADEHALLEASFRKPGEDDEPDNPQVLNYLDVLVDGPHHRKITRRRWDEETRYGCAYCQAPLFLSNTIWVGDSPIHTSCEAELNKTDSKSKLNS